MKFLGFLAIPFLFPAAAFADQKAADGCAAKLGRASAAIYAASAAQLSPGANLRDVVTSVTRGMVMSGDLGRAEARPAAEAAGACLSLLDK
ncbi:hypothetical protein DFR50_105143 [Roseiarcus fermentans]|uniref:UrcA family protein n=1 Tax=Roseiarcus fermentans TaxID=1473586 RepID=A0A366FR28_9HYPH|nr:hypothetical protein [Roseiarcus fermentans]RBP16500.1 hypothetical protein DFR50_105143 [Roseiarcus fermentans]